MRDGNVWMKVYFMASWVVFELPMRDGNHPALSCPHSSPDVFELPMRDGNQCMGGYVNLACEFLNFLWGMETEQHPHVVSAFLQCFWTSYEGWKRNLPLPWPRRSGFVFELPMRDGNKLLSLLFRLYPLVFELPMRDGNFGSSKMEPCNKVRFWTSYEGWKPILRCIQRP